MKFAFSLDKKHTKNQILQILSKQFPLTAKQVCKEFKQKISYQAVHKALQEMAKEGILKKENSKYRVNLAWVQQMLKWLKEIEERIKEKE